MREEAAKKAEQERLQKLRKQQKAEADARKREPPLSGWLCPTLTTP